MRFTLEQAEAVAELVMSGDRRFQLFLSALGDYGEELVKRLLLMDDPNAVETTRGMARAVTNILEAVNGAQSFVEKSKENT